MTGRPRVATIRLGSALVVAAAITGCGGDDDATAPPAPEGLLERAARAMGGKSAVLSVRNAHVEATGQRFDPAEAVAVGEAVHVADFDYELTAEPETGRFRRKLHDETTYLVQLSYEYSEVIQNEHGYVDGIDDMVAKFTGAAKQQPMEPARIATHLKHTDLANPLRLVRHALEHPERVSEKREVDEQGTEVGVLEIGDPGAQPVRVLFGNADSLPTMAETVEDQPPLGDTRMQYAYGDWQVVDGVKLPQELQIRADGIVIHTEKRKNSAIDVPTEDHDYDVPKEMLVDYDPELAAFGSMRPELLFAWQLSAFRQFYQDQSGAPSTFTEIAPGVDAIIGPSHHCLLVELDDALVLVDAPLYDGRSKTVMDEIAARYPGKPLHTIIATHFHHDHTGGIRYFAAEGATTVYAGAPSVPFFERVFESSHTVLPDHFAEKPAEVVVEGVDGKVTLGRGAGPSRSIPSRRSTRTTC